MADTRTLKLSLLADVQKFLDGMDKADNGTKTLNSKVAGYSKKMSKAFLGVATAVGAMSIVYIKLITVSYMLLEKKQQKIGMEQILLLKCFNILRQTMS